jgi:hypothetical protein
MNLGREGQVQEKPVEESIQQIEQDLRFLSWQVSKIEKMIGMALEEVKELDLSTP